MTPHVIHLWHTYNQPSSICFSLCPQTLPTPLFSVSSTVDSYYALFSFFSARPPKINVDEQPCLRNWGPCSLQATRWLAVAIVNKLALAIQSPIQCKHSTTWLPTHLLGLLQLFLNRWRSVCINYIHKTLFWPLVVYRDILGLGLANRKGEVTEIWRNNLNLTLVLYTGFRKQFHAPVNTGAISL